MVFGQGLGARVESNKEEEYEEEIQGLRLRGGMMRDFPHLVERGWGSGFWGEGLGARFSC